MNQVPTLRLYDYYLVSYFPVFIAVVLELFISFVGLDEKIDSFISQPYFSIHWTIRILVFLFVAHQIAYRLNGRGLDGIKAGIFVGLSLGLLYGIFIFIYTPSLSAFFDFLALPWQTLISGTIITGGIALLLSQWKQERKKIIK